GDTLAGEGLGDRLHAFAAQVLGEDPPDRVGGLRVGGQGVQAFSVCCFGRVGVCSGVDEQVSVGRSSAEVAAFQLGLGGHRGTYLYFDAVALGFAHPAEDAHDQVVGFVGRVDRAADLGHP